MKTEVAAVKTDLTAVKTKVDSWPDLHFLQAAVQRQRTDILTLGDEVRVQGAMLPRLDAGISRLDTSHTLLLEEIRATHTQIARMHDRVRKLEDAPAPPL